MKRGNDTSQLRPEEVEALNDADEEVGTFSKASADEISKRKIIKINRSSFGSKGQSSSAPTATAGTSSNPFSGFSGFGASTASTTQPPAISGITAANNPFSSFQGLVTKSVASTNPGAPAVPPVASSFGNASSGGVLGTSAVPSTTSFNAPFPQFHTSNTISDSVNNGGGGNNSINNNKNKSQLTVTTEQSAFKTKLRKLNQSFNVWLQRQMREQPVSVWSEGVKDYIKHYDKLVQKFGDQEDQSLPILPTTTASNTISNSVGSFAFNAKSTEPTTSKINTLSNSNHKEATSIGGSGAAPGAFSFAPSSLLQGADKKTVSSAFQIPSPSTNNNTNNNSSSAPFSFPSFSGSNNSSIGGNTGSNFGASFGGTGSRSQPFSFNPPTSTSTSSSGNLFGAGSGNAGGGGTTEEDDEAEPELAPEIAQKNAQDNDTVQFEANCKLFRLNQENKEWRDTGKGTFRVTRSNDGKLRMLIRNQLGKITFNASFFKSMQLTKNESKGTIQFSAVVADEVAQQGQLVKKDPELHGFILKVRPELVGQLEHHMHLGVKEASH